MNLHLNLFRFYSKSESIIEDNLTRALVICLNHDPIFAFSFFSKILGEISVSPNELPYSDIQVGIKDVPIEGIKHIYPVSITVNRSFDQDAYRNADALDTKYPKPDIILQYEDKLIICEVKVSDEDCLGQLKNQVERVKERIKEGEGIDLNEIKIENYTSLTWENIIGLLESIKYSNKFEPHLLVNNFYDFLLQVKPEWFPIKKLSEIYRTMNNFNVAVDKRLTLIQGAINKSNKDNKDTEHEGRNDWIPIQEEWARQFNIWINDGYIYIGCWPGHNKGQGGYLFSNGQETWNWLSMNGEAIEINGLEGIISIEARIRVFPWRGEDIGYCQIEDMELAKNLFTKKNFYARTGRRDSEYWEDVNQYFSKEIGDSWDKFSNAEWSKLPETEYSFINISMSSCFYIKFKFDDISNLDKNDNEIIVFFNQVMDRMRKIINNNEPYKA